tara:strand:- start:159 stop:551 length:393 start_codon:yes stop_codon:yes gene_type:complete
MFKIYLRLLLDLAPVFLDELLGRVVDEGEEYERFEEGIFTALGNDELLFDDLVFFLVELCFQDEVFFLSFFLAKAKAMLEGSGASDFLLLFKFLEVVFERVVNFFIVEEFEAVLLLDVLFAYLEPLGPLT